MRLRPLLLSSCLAAVALIPAATAQDDVRLPHLGSNADQAFTQAEAEAYGASMLRQMRALGLVLDDPLATQYINALGYRLVSSSESPKTRFTFFIPREDVINSFAAPGGYVGINSGLITATQSEDELAAVMAHEISHIEQHHLQRAFDDARKTTPLYALAMLGALAAAVGSSNVNAPMAIASLGKGLALQRQINFTRKDEAEADRVGIQTLANAGFDPDGMAEFFSRMQLLLRADSGGYEVPALLQDHPVTTLRIAEAEARAHTLKAQMAQRQSLPPTSARLPTWETSLVPVPMLRQPDDWFSAAQRSDAPGSKAAHDYYLMMRERVRVLCSTDLNSLARYYADNLVRHPSFDIPSNHYGYALVLMRSNHADAALKQLAPLLAQDPDNLPLRLAVAHAELLAGQRAQALAHYARISHDWPRNQAVALDYASALILGANQAEGARAEALLRPQLNDSDAPEVYRIYGRAAELAGLKIRAAEAFADATFLSGHAAAALDQLTRLSQRSDLDYAQRARIDARIAWLTPIVLDQRRLRAHSVGADGGDSL
ncbi:MAG: M48 family metalloprotease [Metallibacterium sp.]